MSRPLQRRRGKSLDGSVPGIEYTRFRAGQDHGALDECPPIDSPHPRQEYDPDPGRVDIPQDAYEPYESDAQLQPMPRLRLDPVERPSAPVEDVPTYEDGARLHRLVGELQSQRDLEVAQGFVAGAEISAPPEDLGQLVLEAMQPDPAVKMSSELEQQIEQMEDPDAPPQPAPYQEQQQMYDEETMRQMDPFNTMGPGPMM